MAFSVTCPECEAVLKPVKPLTPGQKVKCPKCGVGFAYQAAGASPSAAANPKAKPKADPKSRRDQQTSELPTADESDGDATPSKSRPTAKSKTKRPEVKTTELPQQKKKPVDDDDDDGGTYTLQSSLQEEDDDKPVIQYIPDAGIKDLRGPANALLVGPSNLLIIAGGLGFLGWLVLLLLMVWPAIFPEPEDPRLKDQQQNFRVVEEEGKKKDEDLNPFKIGDFDLMVVSTYNVGMILVCCLPMVFGMLYSGIVAAGAVKMQNLESRAWSIAAAIMVILPFNFGGFLTVSAFFLNFAFGMLFDDSSKGMPLTIALVLLWLSNVALGAKILHLLFQETVIDGFEYVPEG